MTEVLTIGVSLLVGVWLGMVLVPKALAEALERATRDNEQSIEQARATLAMARRQAERAERSLVKVEQVRAEVDAKLAEIRRVRS